MWACLNKCVFQSPLKGIYVCRLSDLQGKVIPELWAYDGKRPITIRFTCSVGLTNLKIILHSRPTCKWSRKSRVITAVSNSEMQEGDWSLSLLYTSNKILNIILPFIGNRWRLQNQWNIMKFPNLSNNSSSSILKWCNLFNF